VSRLKLRVPHLLAPFCDGETSLQVSGGDVRAALEDAITRHPLLRTHLLDERGRVREHIHLFLNETDVRDDLDAATRDGDELYVLQAMSGGAPGGPRSA
jgi:molybdopterin synthase sulfur carrier subunit